MKPATLLATTLTAFLAARAASAASADGTLVIPTAATVTGARGERFQTDLVVYNPVDAPRRFVLSFFPEDGSGPLTPVVYNVGPKETRRLEDVIHEAFGPRDRAGAITLGYDAGEGPMLAFARAVTVHPEAPGNGTALAVLTPDAAREDATFIGLQGSGERVNVGVFNPSELAVDLLVFVRDASGLFGVSIERRVSPHAWFQVNDVVGEAPIETPGAILVHASLPVFPFVVAVDNRSGDPTYLSAP